ncbi:MAG: hypothetical protein OXH78_11305 [Acidimicrobiaceae bacterium]|nr:hypothetical protein [Acidimicrobiaceae bacterium]
MAATGQTMRDDYTKRATGDAAFPVLGSKGAEGQKRIEAVPDEWWKWNKEGRSPILDKAGHLLVSMGQRTSTARLTAVASDERYVGQGWMPVTGLDATQSKAVAVFLNSTPGRLAIMRLPGKTFDFPLYNPASWLTVPMPDINDQDVVAALGACWEETRDEIVPQYRDGYTDIRRRWDQAVCGALGWDIDEISKLGELLAREPHVKGVAAGQWKQ